MPRVIFNGTKGEVLRNFSSRHTTFHILFVCKNENSSFPQILKMMGKCVESPCYYSIEMVPCDSQHLNKAIDFGLASDTTLPGAKLWIECSFLPQCERHQLQIQFNFRVQTNQLSQLTTIK